MKPTPSQQLAIDTQGCTLLISAAAGSGKTATLTKRIITKLLGSGDAPGADLSRMLVVTFTKAAAAELKSRIGSALTQSIAEHPDDKRLAKQLLNLGSAKICTIDSFYTEPVKTHFAELGIPPQLTLADSADTEPLRREIARELSERFFSDYNTPNGNAFADLLNHVTSKKSVADCGEVLLKIYSGLVQDPDCVKKLEAAAAEKKNDAALKTPIFETTSGKILKKQLAAFLRDAAAYLRKAADRSREIDTAKKPDYLIFEDDMAFYTALYNALPNAVYSEFAAAFDHKYPRCGQKSDDEKTDEINLLRDSRDALKDLFRNFKKFFSFTDEEIYAQFEREAEALSVLAAWTKAFDTAYRTAKEQHGICEFADMRYYMMKLLLDENGKPTAFADELYRNYDEVYIDEYQDVDAAQDAVFAAVGRDHRFMVGDIKQCIYAFRGSRPDIFASYRQQMTALNTPGAVPTKVGGSIFMSENFRCDRPIIDFSNTVCDLLFPLCGETVNYQPEDRLVCGKDQTGITPQPVSVVLFDQSRNKAADDDADAAETTRGVPAETAWIADEIERLLRDGRKDDGSRIMPQDIAVLARTADPLGVMEDELKRRGIPTAFDRNGLDAGAQGETRLLLSVLQVIDNPENDTALEEVLSAAFAFTPQDLVSVHGGENKRLSLFRALRFAAEQDDAVPAETREKCRCFIAWLRAEQRAGISVSTDVFIRRLWQDEHLQPFTAGDTATVIYNDARKRQKNAVSGLHGYVTRLMREVGNNSLVQWKSDACAVNLLTEHKSKGLEFPVCFVAECGYPFCKNTGKDAFIRNSGSQPSVGLKLFSRTAGSVSPTHVNTFDRQITIEEKKTAEKQEEMRLLYVAMTRAREKLYLVGTVSDAEKIEFAAKSAAGGNAALLPAASQPMDWILAAAYGHPDDGTFTLSKPGTCAVSEASADENAAPAETAPEQRTNADEPYDATAERYRAVNEAWASYVYPDAHLQKIPTKLSASSAAPNFIDTLLQTETAATDAETAEWNNLSLHWLHDTEMALNGLSELNDKPKKATAAEKGTALHTFLQFCDWHAVAENGTLSEIDRLVEQGFLADTDADMIDGDAVAAVEKGDLLPLVLRAADVKREVKFHQNLPLSVFTQDETLKAAYAGQTILLQGSVDLLLTMPDGTLTLVDYKTDRIRTEKGETFGDYAARITEAHKTQLQLYADATEQIWGQRPRETYLYSIPAKKLIPVKV